MRTSSVPKKEACEGRLSLILLFFSAMSLSFFILKILMVAIFFKPHFKFQKIDHTSLTIRASPP
jgi:hypothetical protein